MLVLDQAQDLNGQETYKLIQLYGAPDYVKKASVEDLCGTQELPQKSYADGLQRLWATHTPAAVWASAGFLLSKKASLTERQFQTAYNRVLDSAKYFNTRKDIDALQTKMSKATDTLETALTDSDFAMVYTDKNGDTKRHCPMRNSLEVKKAAEYLSKYRDKMPLSVRKQFAEKVIEKAAEYGSDIKSHQALLEKTACQGLCSAKDAAAFIRQRTLCIGQARKGDPMCEALKKFASAMEANPDQSVWIMGQLAEVVDEFDRAHGLDKQYSQGLSRPEDILFGVTKTAIANVTDELAENSLTGNFYKKSDLRLIKTAKLAEVLGQDFAKAVSTAGVFIDTEKLATVLPTLPLTDANLFDQVAAQAGIAPYATKKANDGFKLDIQAVSRDYAVPSNGKRSLWDRAKTSLRVNS